MSTGKEASHTSLLTAAVLLSGIRVRLLLTMKGHNYDFDSYLLVVNAVDSGHNVYASTTRYNYGPIWFHVLHFLYQVASRDTALFRHLLVGLLILVDLAIYAVLSRKLNNTVACFFFLNPLSLIITGFQNQFDNLALLMGMLSVMIIGDDFEKPIGRRKLTGLLLLGLSMATKHILFLFPVWLAIKQKGLFHKLAVVLVPASIFVLSFVPYWHEGKQGILQNVFFYRSFDNACFYRLFIPPGLQAVVTSTMVWIILLTVFGLAFRRVGGFSSLLLYTCVLVATSPAVANQYMAIVVPFIAANLNPFTLCYTLAGTYVLLFDISGLQLYDSSSDFTLSSGRLFYPILTVLLCLGFVWSVWCQQLRVLMNRSGWKSEYSWGARNRRHPAGRAI